MRALKGVAVLGLIAALAVGCSSIQANYDYDPTADFTKFKTYAWMERATTTGTGGGEVRPGDMTDKRIKLAVNTQLAEKGLTEDTRNPDLLLAYYAGIEQKVDVTDWGYRSYGGWYGYGSGYGGYYGRDVSVYYYDQGTIVIDMVDVADQELVWRGVVTDYVTQSNSPQQKEQKINEAIMLILMNYPPPLPQ